jgi:S-adenosylmethionine synthetase
LRAAKSLVAAGLARRCLVQLSYAIGVAEPLSIYVDTYGTGKKSNEELVAVIRKNWDLRPGVMGKVAPFWTRINDEYFLVRELDLQKPTYLKTASYGHFGVFENTSKCSAETDPHTGNPAYTWEKPKQLKL